MACPAARAAPLVSSCARSGAVVNDWGMVGNPTNPMMHECGFTPKRGTAKPDVRLRAQARMRFRGFAETR
jgi:hypothetical protein